MTELAYMVREDWARKGGGWTPQSVLINRWLGGGPDDLVVRDVASLGRRDGVDGEAVRYLLSSSDRRTRRVSFDEFLEGATRRRSGGSALVLHPDKLEEADEVRRVVEAGTYERVFVMIWSRGDEIGPWLDAMAAVDLHTGVSMPGTDPVVLEAAKLMVDQEYNGLASGNGKATVVQLVRAFAARAYLLDEWYRPDQQAWLRAYFAAGGGFRSARDVARLVKEIGERRQHRVQPRYRDDIVDILQQRAREQSSL